MTEKSTFPKLNKWLFICLIVSTSLVSCKKNKIPKVETNAAVNLSPSSTKLNGSVTDEGGASLVERGFVWGKMEMPTIENANIESLSGGTGNYSIDLADLEFNSFYYFRAYAQNKYGIAYGEPQLIQTEGFPYTTASCNPQTNWAYFNNLNMNYYTTANVYSVGYGWSIRGNSNYSDLYIHFTKEPKTGNYVTSGYTALSKNTDCEVSGVFGVGLGYFYTAESGDTVHVENDGNGNFSMSFCGLTFHSGSTTYVFTTDGNLSN